MPTRRNNNKPPKTMTWAKASPILAVCALFDALRIFFEQFWFFGPALAVGICTVIVNGVVETVTFGLLGAGTAAAACTAGGGVLGYFGAGPIEAFGVIMAMAVGLMGWLAVGLLLIFFNARIFEENAGHALWFAGSLLVSEVPIVGTIPALTVIVWRMYRVQIKKEAEALQKYEREQAAALAAERAEQQRQAVALMQARALQQAQLEQAEQEEVMDDIEYAQAAVSS